METGTKFIVFLFKCNKSVLRYRYNNNLKTVFIFLSSKQLNDRLSKNSGYRLKVKYVHLIQPTVNKLQATSDKRGFCHVVALVTKNLRGGVEFGRT